MKGWEIQHNGAGATEKGTTTTPDGLRLYFTLEGEFEYEVTDKDTIKARKSSGAVSMSKRNIDVRKLLFAR
jgi:hypothetical protein